MIPCSQENQLRIHSLTASKYGEQPVNHSTTKLAELKEQINNLEPILFTKSKYDEQPVNINSRNKKAWEILHDFSIHSNIHVLQNNNIRKHNFTQPFPTEEADTIVWIQYRNLRRETIE